jgi:hypothetical protein
VRAAVLALALVAAGAAAADEPASRAAEAADAADAGRRALHAGDYDAAVTALERAVAERPGRLDLHRDLGLALLLLHRVPEACRELALVEAEAPEDAPTARALAVCRRLARRGGAAPHLLAELAFQYDSNVVLDPTAPAPGGGAARTVVRLAAAGRLAGGERLALDGAAAWSQATHLNDRADLGLLDAAVAEGALAATAGGSVGGRALSAVLGARWRESWTDLYRVHYGREVEGEGRLQAATGAAGLASLVYRLRMVRFFDVNLPGANDRNALYQELGLEQRVAAGRRGPLVWGGVAYLRNEAAGDNFDFHGARAVALARLRPGVRLALEALAAYTLRAFVNATPGRRDQELDGTVAAALDLGRGLSLVLGVAHTTNLSTVAADAYTREVVSLALRGTR